MKVLFLANLPSPYRRLFFAELGKKCDLTVIYERDSARDRNKKWVTKKEDTYREIFLKSKKISDDNSISFEIIKYLSIEKYDRYIIGMYSTFTAMIAITYLKAKKISFYLSTDGGFISEESKIKYQIKRYFISAANKWLSTGENSTNYLIHYGAKREHTFVYPFTSLTENDINQAVTFQISDKKIIRNKLGMVEDKILLSVGPFSYENGYGKDFDTLLKVSEKLDKSIGVYIVGDQPTDEFINWKLKMKLDNVHFVEFKIKQELAYYYAAADIFILLTIGDVEGLVINEAMSYSLPVITTFQCNARVELVENGVNGVLVDAGDIETTLDAITYVFDSSERMKRMGEKSFESIEDYSIENMADFHAKILGDGVFKYLLGIKEDYVVLGVGQFIPRKGFDVLLKAAKNFNDSIGVYLIGGTEIKEYKDIIKSLRLNNIHIMDFMNKEEIVKYYKAADVFVLPTREDIWGLVVNEALAYGVPVITTSKCGAGLELIRDGYNGFIVPTNNAEKLTERINMVLTDNERMSRNSIESIKNYTIEKMSEEIMKILIN